MNNIKTAQAIANRISQGDFDFGRVYVRHDGPYVLLNYTNEAMYGGDMTKVEQACRGLVVREDGAIMALPLAKFWNWLEPQCPALPDEPYEVWDKVDGSLGVFWHDGTAWRCTTRGSFDNEYTAFGQEEWDKHDWDISEDWTVMAEVCVDNDPNPRAFYTPEGIYLIAIRDRRTGADLSLLSKQVQASTLCKVLPTPELYQDIGFEDLGKLKAEEGGTEGWVVRFVSGLRVKVKTAWYLRRFKAMMHFSPKHIRELVIEGGDNWLDAFPDDLRPEALAIQQEIEAKFRAELLRIHKAYLRIGDIESRKDFALAAIVDYPDLAHWLFRLRDGKLDEVDVLKALEL